jgi:NAD(P)-dependent dehydrogenase (short-subunit alcohol dehydrogenase family)
VAIAYAREGADVLITYLDEEEVAQDAKSWVEKAGRKAVLVPGDLANPAHCRAVVAKAVEEFGRIDVLVNNAAFQMNHKSLEEISDRARLDAADSRDHAGGESRELRPAGADGPPRTTRRGRAGLRDARLGRGQLRLRCAHRCDRRQADPLTLYAPMVCAGRSRGTRCGCRQFERRTSWLCHVSRICR